MFDMTQRLVFTRSDQEGQKDDIVPINPTQYYTTDKDGGAGGGILDNNLHHMQQLMLKNVKTQ